jgi:glucose-6-phosphate isomerase
MSGCHLPRFEASFEWDPLPSGVFDEFSRWVSAGRLGFINLPCDGAMLEASRTLAGRLAPLVDDVVVDGIGGSALGLRALLSACGGGSRRVHIVDSPDVEVLQRIRSSCNPSRTLLCVITKSGTTAETLAAFLDLYGWLDPSVRDGHTVAVTDPEKGDLRRLASDRGWATLPVPRNVGGRYSVLSPVGVFPAAMAGLDVRALIEGAGIARADFLEGGPASFAGRLAACMLSRFHTHPVHVFFSYRDGLYDMGLWFAQLWAESLGKRMTVDGREVFTGQTPLACRGPADQHSLVQLFMEGPADKVFTFLEAPGTAARLPGGFDAYPSLAWLEGRTVEELRSAEAAATFEALTERGLPAARLVLEHGSSECACGMLFQALETATVLCGIALGIDPLDQPGVERGKTLTFKKMGRPGYK